LNTSVHNLKHDFFYLHWKLRMHIIKVFPDFTIKRLHHHSIHHIMCWCHVMCSTVFGDINNLCNLGVIEKYLTFLCATESFPCHSWVYNENAHMLCTRLTLYFQDNLTCRSLNTCQFSGILNQKVSLWT
jgi:hypothetical protein